MKFVVLRRKFSNPVEASFGHGGVSKAPRQDLGLEEYRLLGSPAIFRKQDSSKAAQRRILRPAAFRPHLAICLVFYKRGFKLPTGKPRLLGARHIQFEAFSHRVTSWKEVESLVGIPICSVGNDKKCLMSRENRLSGISLQWLIVDLEKETISPGFLWYLAPPSGQYYVH